MAQTRFHVAQHPHRGGAVRAAVRVLGGLAVAASIAIVLFFLVVFLSFVSFKAALLTEVIAVGAAVVVWKRTTLPAWLRHVVLASVLLTAIASAAVLRTTWVAQARHDARLAAMVSELCHVSAPEGSSVESCGGSISNTGNGNSCRYLATARVPVSDAQRAAVVASLQDQGFASTDLDVWNIPMKDGRSYLVESDEVSLFLQASWQDDEGDLRCT